MSKTRSVKKAEDSIIIRGGEKYLVCSKCNVPKKLIEENFYKQKVGIGFKSICKECKKEYYKENREVKKAYQLEWVKKNKGYQSEYHKHYDKNIGGAENFSIDDFRDNLNDIVNEEKLLIVDGNAKTKDGREFTRLVGGFGDDKPIFTIWQLAELLNYKTAKLMENLNNNIINFTKGIDYIDIREKTALHEKDSEINLKDFYHYNKLNATKQWIIFSQSGLLKMLKISSSQESWDLYNDFIEDYFRTKVELVVAEKTIQENSDTLLDTKRMLLGSIFMEKDDIKRMELMTQLEKINDQLIQNAKTLAKEETIEQFGDIITIADKFTNGKGCYDIASFCNLLDIKGLGRNNMFKYLKENKILKDNNSPYQNMTEYFKIVKVEKNNTYYTKTLLKAKGVKYIVKKLIKDGYITLELSDVMTKLEELQEVA